MHLFLIRHGETVDNVAGLYAGSRDSALTSHGVLQARRLASHLAEKTALKYIFSSNLQRAVKTAEAIASDQSHVHSVDAPVVQLAALREKDFGSNEGVKFGDSRGTSEVRQRACDAETTESMEARMDSFLNEQLVPLLRTESTASSGCAIVAHGIILGVLYKALCERVGRGGITVDPNPSAAGSLLAPPFWDNTGYLECLVSLAPGPANPQSVAFKLHIKQVNCVTHLKDLKKTRGGIGSAAYDDKQQTLTSFFPAAPKG